MRRNEKDEGRGAEEQRLRRVLEAASARPDEVPKPSPFLMTRLRARVAAARPGETAPLAAIGALAWRVMPALVLALGLLGVWTGVEQARAAQGADDDSISLVEPVDILGDAVVEEPADLREVRP